MQPTDLKFIFRECCFFINALLISQVTENQQPNSLEINGKNLTQRELERQLLLQNSFVLEKKMLRYVVLENKMPNKLSD